MKRASTRGGTVIGVQIAGDANEGTGGLATEQASGLVVTKAAGFMPMGAPLTLRF